VSGQRVLAVNRVSVQGPRFRFSNCKIFNAKAQSLKDAERKKTENKNGPVRVVLSAICCSCGKVSMLLALRLNKSHDKRRKMLLILRDFVLCPSVLTSILS
jgi:hypothetical protein